MKVWNQVLPWNLFSSLIINSLVGWYSMNAFQFIRCWARNPKNAWEDQVIKVGNFNAFQYIYKLSCTLWKFKVLKMTVWWTSGWKNNSALYLGQQVSLHSPGHQQRWQSTGDPPLVQFWDFWAMSGHKHSCFWEIEYGDLNKHWD